ncbi:hypothetical protein [Nocardia sp. NPDC002869]|uniref:hypothetical protein n=1 Tax=Nocardia sp. NPDC002869 TaxID=3161032 RepID=UPI00398CB890
MTEYYVYKEDGTRVKPKEPPTSGYYYTQDGVGKDVTLHYVDPWTGKTSDVKTFKSGESKSLVTENGLAFEKKSSSEETDADNNPDTPDVTTTVYTPDKDKRKESDDRVDLRGTYGKDYKVKSSKDILKKDDKTGEFVYADYKDFPLTIETPVGTNGAGPSPRLIRTIRLANIQLRWLSRQIGTGDINKPKYLMNPEGKNKRLDDNLGKAYYEELGNSGATADSELKVAGDLIGLLGDWEEIDKAFGKVVLKIDDHNYETYKALFDRVSEINGAMALSLVGSYNLEGKTGSAELTSKEKAAQQELNEKKGQKEGQKTNGDIKLTDVGIQHIAEEAELHTIIALGVKDCVDKVDKYVEYMKELAKENPEREKLLDDKKSHKGNDPESEKPPEKDKPGDKPEDKPGNRPPATTTPPPTTTTPPPTTNTPPPTTNTPPPTTNTPPANTEDALKDLNNQYKQILGDSAKTPANGSDPTGATGKGGEKSPSGVTGQPVAGGENPRGAPQVQPAVQAPQASGAPDMSGLMMAGLIPQMLNGMGQDQPGKDGKDKDDKDKDKDKDDHRGRGREVPAPGLQSPGVAPGATDQGAGVQQVAAPTDTGAPPVVTTPGAMVDYKMPDGRTTIQVPQAVSDALTRQQGNPALNAFTAYEGTQASQDMGGTWEAVQGDLKTGDVVRWENHSAVVINDGTGPQYWKDGILTRLDQNGDLDNLGHGKFVQFLRPQGLGEADVQAPGTPTELPEPKVTLETPQAPPSVQAPQEPKQT